MTLSLDPIMLMRLLLSPLSQSFRVRTLLFATPEFEIWCIVAIVMAYEASGEAFVPAEDDIM